MADDATNPGETRRKGNRGSFVKGDSRRNTKGAKGPRKVKSEKDFQAMLAKVLNEEALDKGGQPTGMSNLEIGLRLMMRNPKYFGKLLEYAYGPPVRHVDLSNKDGSLKPIAVHFIVNPGCPAERPEFSDDDGDGIDS